MKKESIDYILTEQQLVSNQNGIERLGFQNKKND